MRITIVNSTIRKGNQSFKVSRYMAGEVSKREGVTANLLDLAALDLPVLWERNHYMEEGERPEGLKKWRDTVVESDALILVVPEYNGGYPAAFKNAFDALYSEYRRKPFGLVSVSSGFGGYTVLTQLRELISRVAGLIVPTTFMARNAPTAFDEEGALLNEHYDKGANRLINEVIWYTEAVQGQLARTAAKTP